MGKRALLFSLLLVCSCLNLTEVLVPPEAEEEPAFLGRFSGVYEGINGDEALHERTILVQLGNKVLFSPFLHPPGQEPALSIFATIIDIDDSGESSQSYGGDGALEQVDIVMDMRMFQEGVASCDPDYSVAVPTNMADFGALLDTCTEMADCHFPCMIPNQWDFAASAEGECIEDGTLCKFPLDVSGRLLSGAVDLFFHDKALVPPSGPADIECPDGSTAHRCLRYPRICDFDSRFAGVYSVELTLNSDASTGTSPPEIVTSFDIAVAVANNMEAVILFDGAQVWFGRLDPVDFTFVADNGKTGNDAAWRFRGDTPFTSIVGQLAEDTTGGRVLLNETIWTVGEAPDQYVYYLTGSRLSGVEPGVTCDLLGLCRPQPQPCPLAFDQSTWPMAILNAVRTNDGCLTSMCHLSVPEEKLCPNPVLACTPDAFEDWEVRYETLSVEMVCPGGDPCGDGDKCLEIRCLEPDETATSENWLMVSNACSANPTAVALSFADSGYVQVDCGQATVACETRMPECPLGPSDTIQTEITTHIDSNGCVTYGCSQYLYLKPGGDECSDASIPSCGAGDVPWPQVRYVENDNDCIEYVCKPSCVATCGEFGCETCADPVVPLTPDCGDFPVRVDTDCGFCLSLSCATPTCEMVPVVCPMGYEYPPNNMNTWFDSDGCIQLDCGQKYDLISLCTAPPAVDDLPTCGVDEVAIPQGRPGVGCVEYACRPSCESTCDPACTCTDPVFADADCLNDGNEIHTNVDGCGCVTLSCIIP